MGYSVEDKDGNPIGIGTVIETDDTISMPHKVGSITEITFRSDTTALKVAGIRGTVENTQVTRVELTEFERIVFNEMSNRKAYLTIGETHEVSERLLEAARELEP